METAYYIDKFNKGVDQLDREAFRQKELELKVGVWLDSVVLKIQKKAWLNLNTNKPFGESVFFSIWMSDDTISQNKLYYNIHALKMRELTGYKIKSRDFAEAFRDKFKTYIKDWPNVSTSFGPLTLMEGWVNLTEEDLENAVAVLATRFLEIAPIIDKLLSERKK